MSYYLAPALAALRNEVNAKWPNRDRTSDGWIGDPSHQARVSDHNPDYDSGGVVRAIDLDVDGIDVPELLRAVIGDPRVQYVIHNRRIYSRTYGWAARAYDGSNPHTSHVHVSIRHTDEAENLTRSWFTRDPATRTTRTPSVSRAGLLTAAKDGKARRGVRIVQRALNGRLRLTGGRRLDTDGVWGPRTGEAYQRWARRNADELPTDNDLRRLLRGYAKVVK